MSNEVQQFRRRFGWSVKDLAQHCGVSPRTVEGWEQGRKPSGAAQKLFKMLEEIYEETA